MKKSELLKLYHDKVNQDKTVIDEIILYIHMPTGEIETITNPNVEEKIKYIEKAYDDNLVLKTCKDIYIEDAVIIEKDSESLMPFSTALIHLQYGKTLSRKEWKGTCKCIQCIPKLNINTQNQEDKLVEEYDVIVKQPIYLTSATNNSEEQVSWTPTISDIFADDWYIVENKEEIK